MLWLNPFKFKVFAMNVLNYKIHIVDRFQLPPFEDPDESVQMSLLKEATARHGIRAKLRGDEIYQEGLKQAPRFLLNMEHYPKVISSSEE